MSKFKDQFPWACLSCEKEPCKCPQEAMYVKDVEEQFPEPAFPMWIWVVAVIFAIILFKVLP